MSIVKPWFTKIHKPFAHPSILKYKILLIDTAVLDNSSEEILRPKNVKRHDVDTRNRESINSMIQWSVIIPCFEELKYFKNLKENAEEEYIIQYIILSRKSAHN